MFILTPSRRPLTAFVAAAATTSSAAAPTPTPASTALALLAIPRTTRCVAGLGMVLGVGGGALVATAELPGDPGLVYFLVSPFISRQPLGLPPPRGIDRLAVLLASRLSGRSAGTEREFVLLALTAARRWFDRSPRCRRF